MTLKSVPDFPQKRCPELAYELFTSLLVAGPISADLLKKVLIGYRLWGAYVQHGAFRKICKQMICKVK